MLEQVQQSHKYNKCNKSNKSNLTHEHEKENRRKNNFWPSVPKPYTHRSDCGRAVARGVMRLLTGSSNPFQPQGFLLSNKSFLHLLNFSCVYVDGFLNGTSVPHYVGIDQDL